MSVKSLLLLAMLALGLAGCGSSEEKPVEGDNPAAATGRDVTPEMAAQRVGAPPRNTLPPGEGRSGGGTGGAGGTTTR